MAAILAIAHLMPIRIMVLVPFVMFLDFVPCCGYSMENPASDQLYCLD